MRTTTKECKHCGIEYSYYLSGNCTPDYNSDTYCNGCEKVRRKAIEEAFKTVPVLFKHEFILTDDFTLEELLKIEEDKYSEHQNKIEGGELLLPIARRVWPTLYDWDKQEHKKYSQVRHDGELYSYSYWPSKPEEAEIRVYKRIDMTTREPVDEFRAIRDDE